ncbi:hypothetical protein N7495_004003 [Penicillium taxi]|uniref:uncharacterized protein n=1 Tax=Penicillium taxi TaxID=168475 RepID=UPI0025451BB7|nr:uncharacterized protein N7495_004003 [Penicillium taxi]KAJ5899259.1 hypothetical protein N7495_004003 [Penicillium taxi]
MASTSLTASYLTPDPSFNWFFLLELIVSCILVLFFLLYFNRLFATLLSYGIRAYTWHYYRAYVDINALQVSLLGGRVFFKGIRYHGVNETIFIHGGFITWRYWKRNVEKTNLSSASGDQDSLNDSVDTSDFSNENGGLRDPGGAAKVTELPCRIALKAYGLEWFIYNRTPAYDNILAGFGYTKGDNFESDEDLGRTSSVSPETQPKHQHTERMGTVHRTTSSSGSASTMSDRGAQTRQHTDMRHSELSQTVSNMLELLPLKLDCRKGAIVIGNENTKSVLTTTFDNATGIIAASKAGPLDLYRQLLSFQIDHPVVQMRPNPDFKQTQQAMAKSLGDDREDEPLLNQRRGNPFSYRFQRRKLWHSIRDLVPYFQSSVESFHIGRKPSDNLPRSQAEFPEVHWTGLTRYLDEADGDDHEIWNSVEYARFSTILDSPSLEVTYFWDIPGRVVPQELATIEKRDNNVNQALPPEWGIDIKISSGVLNYGPWADRERVNLQNVFFPNFYRSSEPAEQLAPGALRQSVVFKLRVEISDELTLRIPIREPSKDWQWKGRADAIGGVKRGHSGPDIRPFGWISLRMGPDSTVNYVMDMVASKLGFQNELSCDLRGASLSSSVNHGLIYQCPQQIVTCDLSNPLCWNSLRSWRFTIESKDMELFLLRDHVFLMTDLISDWASGPPSDYYTFVPFIYNIDLVFSNLQLFVNVNDRNIISNPSDLEDNRFIVIKGKKLTSNVLIPLNKYKPEQNAVEFSVNLEDGGVNYLTPLWDTLHSYLPVKSMATLDTVYIDGSYNYFLSTAPDLTDTLVLNVSGVSPRLYLYGVLIKAFMGVKENYFSDEMHFKTLEEYRELAYAKEPPLNSTGINPNRKSNDMDVLVRVTVDNPCALLPESIYENSKCSRLRAASLEVDLRFTNYYMDMHFSISPLKVDLQSIQPDGTTFISGPQLFFDGVSVYGHRLFGLPPDEPTYICNWDFEVGKILGECSPEFLSCLGSGLKSFDFSFDNEENTLHPLVPPVLYDVTFLRAKVDSIHISILLEQVALVFSSKPLSTKFNDWANTKFSKRMSLLIPDITFAAVDRQVVGQALRSSKKTVTPLGILQLTVGLKMAVRREDIAESRRLQQEHIRIHDQRTHRAQWLLSDWDEVAPTSLLHPSENTPPNMAIPSMPEPIHGKFSSVNAPSYRGFSATHAAASSRSFLVRSETPSLKSTKSQGKSIPRPASTSNSDSTRKRPRPPTRDASRSTLKTNRVKDSESFKSKAGLYSLAAVRDANPWILPQFSYYELSFDTSELPSSSSSNSSSPKDEDTDTHRSMFLTFEDDQTTHTNLSLNLPLGIRGYLTPRFLFSLSALLDGFEPKHPLQIIDSLQKDVISDIVGYEKSINQPKKALAVALRIPSIQLKLVDFSVSPNDRQVEFRDEYRIEVHHLRTEFQRRVERHKNDLLEGVKQAMTVHAAAKRLSIVVEGSRPDTFHEKAAFNCDLEDLNFWLVTTPNIRFHVQMRTFNTVTSAKSVERLAFLVRRATTMFDSVASSFQHVSTLSTRRLRFLIFFATQSAAHIPDPIFLARISNVLRVASAHLRQHDSWKIISRIRNIYNSLPANRKWELQQNCLGDNPLCRLMLSHLIWSCSQPDQSEAKPSLAVSGTIQTFRFSLDPGPRESDFIIENLSSFTSVVPEHIVQDGDRTKLKELVTVQAYCSSVTLRLRWEIMDLIEGMMKIMSSVTLESSPAQPSVEQEPKEPLELQIVFGTDLGSITLDGINIKLVLFSRALRASIVHTSDVMKKTQNKSLAVLLASEACSSELSSQSRPLMLSKITDPSLYFSLVSQETHSECMRDWKVSGSCKKLRYDVKEDPVSLAHTVDRLIEDEIRYIQYLANNANFPKAESELKPPSKKPARDSIHMAMFLDDYRLSFNLLPSLVYLVYGDVSRISVMPTAFSKIQVDFDVKKTYHRFMSSKKNGRDTLSVMEIPSLNGRILANILSDRKEFEVDITIEVIRLEASAVRSLLSVLEGPDVSHLISDLKQNVDVLQSRLEDVLSLQKVKPKPKSFSEESVVLYKSRLTMAGLEIHAIAPGLNKRSYSAEMIFSLGIMQMRLQNGLDRGYSMEYPEFSIDACQINFELRRLERGKATPFGGFSAGVKLLGTTTTSDNGEVARSYQFTVKKFDIELFAETAALVVDIAIYTQERIKTLDLSHEVQRIRRLHRNNHSDSHNSEIPQINLNDDAAPQNFLDALFSLNFFDIQVAWNMPKSLSGNHVRQPEDLVFSIQHVELSNKKKNAAKLRIDNMQLQMVPFRADRKKRSLTSALMPELVFNIAYFSSREEVRLAFQAAGKSLDIRATSEFILPANMIRNSIASATEAIREGKAAWATNPSLDDDTKPNKDRGLFAKRRVRSVLVDVDFAGATVSLQGNQGQVPQTSMTANLNSSRLSDVKYGEYVHGESATTVTLRAPGVALKVQFDDNGTDDPALNAELKISPSTNVLYPTFVPLVKQMTATVKEIMGEQQTRPRCPSTPSKLQSQKPKQGTAFGAQNPNNILGRCKVNLGVLFCQQAFTLSCQPIARVAASAKFESVYVTVNTVQSSEGRFLALSMAFNNLEASIKHVYSHESTASFELKSVVLSLMNSKHLGLKSGMSVILRVSPMKVCLNAKQVQESLLFKEIWLPPDEEPQSSAELPPEQPQQPEAQAQAQADIVRRYQKVSAASAFPWNTTIAIEKLDVQLDLGSTLGKAQFAIDNLWVSSSKTSDREQSMCINFDAISAGSKGRMSGIVELRTLKIRTSIKWPEVARENGHTPLIQASIAIAHLQANVSFDYQPFLVAHIAMFDFLMYNVCDASGEQSERLFSTLEGDKVQVFCTSLTASQALALFQAWQRLVQDKQAAYEASLREIERYLRRKSSVGTDRIEARAKPRAKTDEEMEVSNISLHTEVVVSIRHVNLGAFPSSFFDNQIFKLEAHDAQARFGVSVESDKKIHTALGLTLGQLRVALSAINRPPSASLDELSVEEIAQRAVGSRGGTILKVPRLVSGMETWQVSGSRHIDYIFHSTFEGKVDVGWNYSRISFIRDMWETHLRALATRLGKPLPPSAVRITGGPGSSSESGGAGPEQQEKITAVVNVPQSKYTYTALKPPVIDTPQLRDMGEATPPLEWIGLQRDKLPNVTHQIIIVTLLEIAKEVEDAYGKILGV